MIGRVDILAVMDRGNSFWYGREINSKNVGEYIKELKQMQKKMKDIQYDIPSLIEPSKEQFDSILRVLDDEIKYCQFYFEYNRKARKENFNQWVFYKEKDRPKRYDWERSKGDSWFISNGRIKAEINIKKGVTTKIWLEYWNDSEHLTFYTRGYSEKEEKLVKHLRKKESIEQYVHDLKIHVERVIFNENLYPYTKEKQNFELLNKLLHN